MSAHVSSERRVSADGLGKRYKVYRHPSARVLEWLSNGRYFGHHSEWVLRDVSFEVRAGESLGIVGMNGAGKSTLLKILSGTTLPSEGTFAVRGRIAALLELGLGVHPEFDGWQNATLACQLMGMGDAAIAKRLKWIQSFSELGDHMDQPVRTYSTGMQVRLAFSIATAERPDVLIVDEALAVGDVYFQHKSMARIREFQSEGTSLLFVTHDPGAVKSLCTSAILLDGGRLVRAGSPEAVLDYYNAMIAQKERGAAIEQAAGTDGGTTTRSGSRLAEILAVEVTDREGHPSRSFGTGDALRIVCHLRINEDMPAPTVGFVIRDRLGNDVFGSNTFHLRVPETACRRGDQLRATFDVDLRVGAGSYSLSMALHSAAVHIDASYDWWDRAVVFRVDLPREAPFTGVAALPVRVALERSDASR